LGRIIGSKEILERELHRIDGKPYGAYKDLKGIFAVDFFREIKVGVWDFGTFLLSLDRIQSDPYAPPSKARVRVPQSTAGFPHYLYRNKSR
jgi:predicted ABC-class ATPase